MANYFYTDENGQKYSLTEQRLQTLVDRGVITPNTPLETDTGHTGLAGQIPGLNFDNVAPPRTSRSHSRKDQSQKVTESFFWIAIRDLSQREINLRLTFFYWFCVLWVAFFPIFCWEWANNSGVNDFMGVLINTLINGVINLVINPFMWFAVITIRLAFDLLIVLFASLLEIKNAARKYND